MNGGYYASAFLCGVVAGTGAGLLLSRVLLRNLVDARVTEQLNAERAHRETRAEAGLQGGNPAERPETALGVNDTGHDDEERGAEGDEAAAGSLDAQDDDRKLAESGRVNRSRAGDDGAVAPEKDPWPPLNRDTTRPYIISADEFSGAADAYFKISLKWFQGDAIPVMTDSDDKPIPSYEEITGPIGYRSFGGPSEDDNIVYIRNEQRMSDFEVVRSFGSYAEEVLNYGRP